MDDSPSKVLAEDLKSFHISSPKIERANLQEVAKQANLKRYVPNNDFADSKFISYLGDSNSKSYVKKLGDWSMNYGTVQQKSKSPSRNIGNSKTSLRDENFISDNDENVEPPQFKQYLQSNYQRSGNRKEEKERRGNNQYYEDPESDLILTASLNDISGIPTNTFKRHNKKKQVPLGSDSRSRVSEQNPIVSSARSNEVSEEYDEDDIDPALEARGVFDNILRNQKSNYEIDRAAQIDNELDSKVNKDRTSSDTGSSSYFGETPSSLSPNFDTNRNEKPVLQIKKVKTEVDGMGLIKPEDVGLVFNNIDGVWYKPPVRNQDISSSRTTDNTFSNTVDSNNTTATTELGSVVTSATATATTDNGVNGNTGLKQRQNKNQTANSAALKKQQKGRSIATSNQTRLSKVQERRPYNKFDPPVTDDAPEEVEDEEQEYDDTPLDIPQINPKFIPINSRNDSNSNGDNSISLMGRVNESDKFNKKELIKILTDIIPPLQNEWLQVTHVDLSKKQLRQLKGLDEILPNLVELDLAQNEIVDFSGIPSSVLSLNLSGNEVTTNYCRKHLPELVHLESLNLANNRLDYNLNFLTALRHLKNVDLSFNEITSINDNLGISRIRTLNLSYNSITGVIDFEKIIKYNSNVYCNRSVGWLTVEELDLSNNKITELRNLHVLRNLRTLHLDNNPVSHVTEVEDHPLLHTLTVTNTGSRLTKVDVRHYKRLRTLRIDLHDGLIACDEAFLPPDLEELHLGHGTVSQMPRWSMVPATLQRLTLTAVRGLNKLPRELPSLLPFLKELNLTGNELASWYSTVDRIPTSQLRNLILVGNPLVFGLSREEIQLVEQSVRLICPKIKHITLYADAPSWQVGD